MLRPGNVELGAAKTAAGVACSSLAKKPPSVVRIGVVVCPAITASDARSRSRATSSGGRPAESRSSRQNRSRPVSAPPPFWGGWDAGSPPTLDTGQQERRSMMADGSPPALHVPARDIPVPASVSAQAQAFLAQGLMRTSPRPSLDDLDAWRKTIAATEDAMLPMYEQRASRVAADIAEIDAEGTRVYVVTPDGTLGDDRRVFLDVHGGALIQGGGETCRLNAIATAGQVGARTWAVDYRMPPDHPYPTPLDDCVSAYRAILRDHRPDEVIVGGGSAGANLAAALILRARDEGLPLPAAAVLLTPELDLTESGDSFQTNAAVDIVGSQSLIPVNLLYADGHDLAHPYLSPLFGDFVKGFPPTLLTAGTRDVFLSNAVRMHRALRTAAIPAELHIFEAAPHGGFFGTAPEDGEVDRQVRQFVDTCWARSN
ncbi:alpha/beta hydrolase [Streptosporangium sp. NPDC005286]|uniref:alpha/beta hydrolase n=1 Tax=Streptosporangium sp. NPDC005286 TaxID=3154463 RepID=UPI0033A51CB6